MNAKESSEPEYPDMDDPETETEPIEEGNAEDDATEEGGGRGGANPLIPLLALRFIVSPVRV